jgi:hypothetical protein
VKFRQKLGEKLGRKDSLNVLRDVLRQKKKKPATRKTADGHSKVKATALLHIPADPTTSAMG